MNDQTQSQRDSIEHVAVVVADIEKSVQWYRSSFSCEVLSQGKTHAMLQFENIRLSLVLPSQEQPHLAFVRTDAQTLGELRERADGTLSTYLSDSTGNVIKIIKK